MTNSKTRVLIAGATGYLGQHLVKAYVEAGYSVRVLVRNREKLKQSSLSNIDVVIGEATNPATLKGCCDGIDVVVSALGITRQKDGLTYDQVDYQANRNLLDEALKAGAYQFTYVHVLKAEGMPNVAMAQAKAKFAAELKKAPIASTLICPSGFFSDLSEILTMAQKGRVYLFGDGEARVTPIHGADLAKLTVDVTEQGLRRVEAGGPETLTQNQIAELAFQVLGKQSRITHIPLWIGRTFVGFAKLLGRASSIGPLEFFLTASALDMSAKTHGSRRLIDDFRLQISPQSMPNTAVSNGVVS